MEKVFKILNSQLQDPNTSWSIGAFGVVAEFHRDAEEKVDIFSSADRIQMVTKRGAIQINQHSEICLIPYELLSRTPGAWSHGVLVCLPTHTARLISSKGVTDLGSDKNALMPSEEARLFDLGFGFEFFKGCVRSANSSLWDALASAKNIPFLELSDTTTQTLKKANPVRVFYSRIARIEVAQAIPHSQSETPMGPHTHVLPSLLIRQREQAASIPIPDGFTAVLAFFPPHPIRNIDGTIKAFDRQSFEAFQLLFNEHGVRELIAAKHKAWELIDRAETADIAALPQTRHARIAFRVALRQWEHINGCSSNSIAWRQLCDPTSGGKM